MKIAIGCDPNASALKTDVMDELISMGHEVRDYGSDDPIYANVVISVAEAVVRGEEDRGVVMCGTGIGASIAANKVSGIYCALVTTRYQAERAALSNNANMIAMGAQITGAKIARLMARVWMENTKKFDPEGRSGPKVNRIVEYAASHEKNS